MLAQMVRSENDLQDITKSTKAIIFSYRPSMINLMNMMNKGKNIKTVMVAKSYLATMGPGARKILELNKIELKETPIDYRGTRTDINGKIIEIADGE
jgi:hypothetical protein